MSETIHYRFLVRGGTAANLSAVNEVPKHRELIVETDTGKMKLGDGATPYNDLDYVGGVGGLQSIVAGANIDVDNSDPANPIVSARGGGASDPVSAVDVFEDFISTPTSDITGAFTYSASRGHVEPAVSAFNGVGVVKLVATSPSGVAINVRRSWSSKPWLVGSGRLEFEARAWLDYDQRIDGVPRGTGVSIGLWDSDSGSRNNGVYFRASPSFDPPTWWAYVAHQGSSDESLDTGVIASADTPAKLSFAVDSEGASVHFLIDGVSCGVLPIPAGLRAIGLQERIQSWSVTGYDAVIDKGVSVDYLRVQKNVNR